MAPVTAPDPAPYRLVFEHRVLTQRVLFGSGAAAEHLRTELERLGARRSMVVVAPSAAGAARHLLEGIEVAVWFEDVVQHVPVASAERARATARQHDVDVVVSVGGGSATGLAKAGAQTTGLPVVAVPTTYSGSEATDVWGLTQEGRKTTGSDERVLPRAVVYDAELTVSMPVGLSVASGLNTMAHCVDSLWGPTANPVATGLAVEGARLLGAGLPLVVADPGGLRGRELTLAGAYLAAVAFAGAGSGLHHKICHVLGGAYDLPHAPTHAVVLPHVLAHNAAAVPDRAGRLALALGAAPIRAEKDPAQAAVDALEELRVALSAPRSLAEVGLAEADLSDAVARCLPTIPESNPVPVTEASLTALLHAAWAGDTPTLQTKESR